MCRLKASFTITVLETRTDQNSFFHREPSWERWIILSRVPRRQHRPTVSSLAPNHQRNSGTDWPEFPPLAYAAATALALSYNIYTRRYKWRGSTMPANQIRLSDIAYNVLECDIRPSTAGLVIYRHTWVFIARKDLRVNGIRGCRGSTDSFIFQSRLFVRAHDWKISTTPRIDLSNVQFNRVSLKLVKIWRNVFDILIVRFN